MNTDPSSQNAANRPAYTVEALVEASDDAIIGKTLDNIIVSWNRGAERMYGYTSAEAIGKSMEMLVPQDRAGEPDEIIHRIGRGEPVEHFETVRVAKDGRRVEVSLIVSPTRDSAG